MNATLAAILMLSGFCFLALEVMVGIYVAACIKWSLLPGVTAKTLFLYNQFLPVAGAAFVAATYFVF